MNVYFVRHGESTYNAQKLHQHGQVELSNLGLKQAEVVAQRFLSIPIDVIFTSPFTRAKQTAEAIHNVTHKPLEFLELFIERKRPSFIEGKTTDNPEVVKVKEQILENFNNPKWRHSDEETFFDFRVRAVKAINFLSKRKEKNILVVSHGEFIRMMLTVMVFGENVSPDVFLKINTFMKTKNTGITFCKYVKDTWALLTWNDHVHLGEI